MGRIRRHWFVVGIVMTLLPIVSVWSAPLRQANNFDVPLLAANMCGSGDEGETHFTIAATGDTFPHENIQAVGETQGYDVLFDYLRPFLRAADLGYTNFDGAMLAGSAYTGYPAFNYNPQLATALKNAGISLVSTANNHILDRGSEGLDATLRVLESAGIAQHGTASSEAAQAGTRPTYLPLTLTRDNVSITIGFVSVSWGTNGIPDPYNQVNLLWQSNEYGQQGGIRQSVLDAVAQARRETDIVIVAAHWGYEYQFFPDASQIEGARQLTAAGADIILGAQSHTLQPVDLVEAGGRRSLVIYSLANFIASQGAFQAQSYSATSVVFYIGLVHRADGSVAVTGYRYLPTLVIDNDTRPAPLPAGYDDVLAHVRAEMRDPGGLRQISADPAQLGARVDVCPTLHFAETPDTAVGGDFAQHLLTGGTGVTPYGPDAVRAIWGLPIAPAKSALAGDCSTTTPVLLTERQRLELHANEPWPYRITGTQIGTAIYEQRYKLPAQRQTDLDSAFAVPVFRTFFTSYGGVPVFGYPISGPLQEHDRTVQYFERARFELVPGADLAQPLAAVQLGLLGREFAGIESLCGSIQGEAPAISLEKPTSDAAQLPVPSAVTDVQPSAGSATQNSIAGPGRFVLALLGIVAFAGIVAITPMFVRAYRREQRLRNRRTQIEARRRGRRF